MKEKVIEIRNLSFSINGKEILKNIILDVYKGEFIGLIGPNGSGKTTLLKSINGINKCKGTIKIEQQDINQLTDREIALKIALMNQNTIIGFPFPAEEIVLMGRYPHLKKMQRISKNDRDIANKYMKFTNTFILKDKPITNMSGGERQRVLFSKVLVQETEIILLDEPTASLDITHEEQIFKYSKEMSKNGKTVITAVHDLRIAAKYCDRLILIKDGRIISDGIPKEVLTSENIKIAYDVKAFVYENPFTSLIDFYTYDRKNLDKNIHVICGGGSGSQIIHYLFEKGYRLSCGVLQYGDTDFINSEIMGIDIIKCMPFNDISEELMRKNIESIMKSNLTILTNMFIGKQNISNLIAARYSNDLIIIEDTPIENRDFTGGEALNIYNELKKNAKVIKSKELQKFV